MLKLCGSNKCSQHGEGSNNKNIFTKNPTNCPPIDSSIDSSTISSYSLYSEHAVAITKNGIALATGENSDGRIIKSLPKEILSKFTKFEIKNEVDCTLYPISAVCGNYFTLYLVSLSKKSKKTLLAYSYKEIEADFPLFLNIGDIKPVALFGGFYTAAAIDDKSSVIFIPEYNKFKNSPSIRLQRSSLPDSDNATSVACCKDIIFVAGSSGRVFESKIPDTGNVLNFSLVESLKGTKIKEVSGTNEHCFAVTEDGRVFGYGDNEFGQLGFNFDEKFKFNEIPSLNRIDHAYAGKSHSLFQTFEGEILACGANGSGELFGKSPNNKYVTQVTSTLLTEGATFCVAGYCSSAAFINHDPVKSPNRRIGIQKSVSSSTSPDPLALANAEISRLKTELSRMKSELDELRKSCASQPQPPTSMQPDIELLDQSEISSLKIVETIGRGGQSQVFKVSRNEFYALKVLDIFSTTSKSKKKRGSSPTDQLRRHLREYEITRNLSHPNIIRSFGFCYGDDSNPPSILLEYCEHNLNDVAEDLTEVEKVCSIYEISLGMAAVHKAGLIHRDLKPANILIDSNKHSKVSDFGISCFASVESQTQSMTGGVGTLKFMAPELLNDSSKYTNKVDVYSFVVVVFFVLTGGELPRISFADQVNGKKAKIPSSLNKMARDLISRCWSAEADDRPSFDEIAKLIRENDFKLIDGVEKEIVEIKKFLSI